MKRFLRFEMEGQDIRFWDISDHIDDVVKDGYEFEILKYEVTFTDDKSSVYVEYDEHLPLSEITVGTLDVSTDLLSELNKDKEKNHYNNFKDTIINALENYYEGV